MKFPLENLKRADQTVPMSTKNVAPHKKLRPKGIFCLEGDWTNDLKRPSTVRPILELLSAQHPYPQFIHRGIGTREELEYYLKKWTQKQYSSHPILYLAFHGEEGTVCVGDQRKSSQNNMTLDDLADLLENSCKNRLIHIGGCSTLHIDRRHIQRFLQRTGASAVSGFKTEVDWMTSTALEVILFETIQDLSTGINGAKAIENRLVQKVDGLVKDCEFRIVVRDA